MAWAFLLLCWRGGQAVAALPEGQVILLFLLPALVAPSQAWLADFANTRQISASAMGQEQAHAGAAQQQVIQMQHQLVFGGEGQFGPQRIGGANTVGTKLI